MYNIPTTNKGVNIMPSRRARRTMLAGAAVASSRSNKAAATPAPTPAPAETPQAGLSPDVTKQLTDLKGLLDNGILTQEEFDAKKTQILGL
jgi:hypothetical protein